MPVCSKPKPSRRQRSCLLDLLNLLKASPLIKHNSSKYVCFFSSSLHGFHKATTKTAQHNTSFKHHKNAHKLISWLNAKHFFNQNSHPTPSLRPFASPSSGPLASDLRPTRPRNQRGPPRRERSVSSSSCQRCATSVVFSSTKHGRSTCRISAIHRATSSWWFHLAQNRVHYSIVHGGSKWIHILQVSTHRGLVVRLFRCQAAWLTARRS